MRLLTAALSILFFLAVFWFANHLLAPVRRSGPPVTVDIPPGASAASIARRLKRAGLIRSEIAFKLMARLYGGADQMKAGEYRIPPTLGVIQIIDKLVAGDAESQWITIPEGKTVREIARMLEARRIVPAAEFLRAAERKPKAYGLMIPVARRSVEGYLMPDTYRVPRYAEARSLIRMMLRNWNAKVLRPNRELFARSDLSLDQIVIVASMIEREARVPADRPLIASVIRNRLARKQPLQVDATVLYALGRHKSALSYRDLKVRSPYNTYAIQGLPPGPICNPGVEAIRAALQPAQTDYLYYVARPDGSHIFSRTLEEHEAAIARARELRAAAGGRP